VKSDIQQLKLEETKKLISEGKLMVCCAARPMPKGDTRDWYHVGARFLPGSQQWEKPKFMLKRCPHCMTTLRELRNAQ
jgi:hypothetical protein